MGSRAERSQRRIRYEPDSQAALGRGIDLLARTLGPTIGPCAAPVAIAPIGRPGLPPELLDDGATIAIRMVGIPDRFENMGFMLARQAAWRMRTTAGDGASSAVTIGAATLRHLNRLAQAGYDRRMLADSAAWAADIAMEKVAARASPLQPDQFPAYSVNVLQTPEAASVVSTVLGQLGPDVPVMVRASVESRIHHQLIEGALWESTSVLAPALTSAEPARLVNPAVLLWDGPADDPRSFALAMSAIQTSSATACVVIARSFSTPVLGLIARNAGARCRVVPLIAPQAGNQQDDAFGDLEALTGARRLSPQAGDLLDRIELACAGSAPRVTIGPRFINVMAGRSRQGAIDCRIASVQARIDRCDDENELGRLTTRLGRLQQGMGIVWVGASSGVERARIVRQVEQGIHTLRAAQASGVVPGAGSTLLAISRELRACETVVTRPGVLAVAHGLEAPALWLARNAGMDPNLAVARQCDLPPGAGIDGTTGDLVELVERCIFDPVSTVQTMIQVGVSMALSAFSCEVLIERPVRLSQAEIRP